LAKNAQINIRDRFDNTPLSIALRNNHYDIAKLMLFFKADIHFKVSSKGQTLLHSACEEGSETKVRFLLENGATAFRTNRDDETPLFKALVFPHIVKILCHHVDPANLIKLIRSINSRGETVVHTAVKNDHIDALLAIIESIPLPQYSRQLRDILNDNEKTHQNNTPLHLAVMGNHLAIMKLLVMCDEIDMAKQNGKKFNYQF
jgi:ankyrin repeat protein